MRGFDLAGRFKSDRLPVGGLNQEGVHGLLNQNLLKIQSTRVALPLPHFVITAHYKTPILGLTSKATVDAPRCLRGRESRANDRIIASYRRQCRTVVNEFTNEAQIADDFDTHVEATTNRFERTDRGWRPARAFDGPPHFSV